MLDDALGELQATREVERLAAASAARPPGARRRRRSETWGQTNLVPDVFETLASSYDGVLAIHQMMQGREPAVLNEANGPRPGLDEAGARPDDA